MLPNVRFMAASVVATIALMLFGFALFAAFRLANQSSVLQAHTNDATSPAAFANRPVGPPLIIIPPVARAPDPPEANVAQQSPPAENTAESTPPPAVADRLNEETTAAAPEPQAVPPAVQETVAPAQSETPPAVAAAPPDNASPASPAEPPANSAAAAETPTIGQTAPPPESTPQATSAGPVGAPVVANDDAGKNEPTATPAELERNRAAEAPVVTKEIEAASAETTGAVTPTVSHKDVHTKPHATAAHKVKKKALVEKRPVKRVKRVARPVQPAQQADPFAGFFQQQPNGSSSGGPGF